LSYLWTGRKNLKEYEETLRFGERLCYELRRLNDEYKELWDQYANLKLKPKEKLLLAQNIFNRFEILHDPQYPVPKARTDLYAQAITRQHIKNSSSVFLKQSPIRILDGGSKSLTGNGRLIPSVLLEEELKDYKSKLKKAKSKQQRKKIKDEVASRFCPKNGEGLWVTIAFNVWEDTVPTLHHMEKTFYLFRDIFSKKHNQKRTLKKLNVALYCWKLKNWKKLEPREIAPIYLAATQTYLKDETQLDNNLIDKGDAIIG